ncbi:MAG: MoaD/ThiS family protein [Candidatus Nanopelagicales bacterium]
MAVTVRLFAAAREAAGTSELTIDPGAVLPQLREIGPRFATVLEVCSVVSDGLRLGPDDEVPDGAVVDVLPPFAGG